MNAALAGVLAAAALALSAGPVAAGPVLTCRPVDGGPSLCGPGDPWGIFDTVDPWSPDPDPLVCPLLAAALAPEGDVRVPPHGAHWDCPPYGA